MSSEGRLATGQLPYRLRQFVEVLDHQIGRERLDARTLAGIFVVTAGIVLLVAFGRG